jgi:beta-lactamase regulating signal transducer with metallopeptidase domain
MPSLSQSPILQALGYAIAHSLWQMALVWIVYVLLNSLFKFKSEIKYRIAVAAQVVGFAWFIGTLQFYYIQCSQALRMAEAIYLQNGDQSSIVYSGSSGLLSFFIKAEQILPYLSVAYLLLLAFLTIRWFKAYQSTQIVRLNGLHKIDVDWKLFVTKVAGQLGIKQKVRIYLSELVKSPVTIGFLKPVILVPIASFTHLSAQQLEAVILHELAHIKRHDYLLNIALSIIDLGLFFNPFTRLITKSISKERENSCDDWVLQYQYNPSMYAEALLRIAVLQKTPAMAMYAVKTKSELASRVHRMLSQKDGGFNYRHQLIALLLMTGILATIAWYDPNAIKNRDTNPSANNQPVVLEPLAVKVDNPLFNPMFFLNEPLKAEVKKNAEASQKQMRKLKKENELAIRQIEFPRVMAPVAIENLQELERNINSSVNKQLKKLRYSTIPGNMRFAEGQLFNSKNADAFFQFDTMKFASNLALGFNVDWEDLTEKLTSSRIQIEEAVKRGKISEIDAKRMKTEIANAFRKLKDTKMPQFYGFAPPTAAIADGGEGTTWFYKGDEDDNNEAFVRERKANEKRQIDSKEKNARIRRFVVDTMKRRVFRTVPTAPLAVHFNGHLRTNENMPPVVIEYPGMMFTADTSKAHGAATVPAILHRATAKALNKTNAAATYAYVYTNDNDGNENDVAKDTDKSKSPVAKVSGRCKTVKVTANNPRQIPTQLSLNSNKYLHNKS